MGGRGHRGVRLKRLEHGKGEAEKYYRSLKSQSVRVGVEATGQHALVRALAGRVGARTVVGRCRQIRAAAVGRQKYDKRDANLVLQLLIENRFPRL